MLDMTVNLVLGWCY